MNSKLIFVLASIFLLGIVELDAHGHLRVPPARSTAWREDSVRFPINYNDYEMNCGGKSTQWDKNGGKCGICGEDYSKPKRYEKGGDLYRGFVVRSYKPNEQIDINLHIINDHMGTYEFRLCNVDKMPNGEATQECLDQTLLADSTGTKQFKTQGEVVGNELADVTHNHKLVIPANFKCDHCVLQWKWNVGNSWGVDFVTGERCNKCGPQEQFFGCSDIRISDDATPIVNDPVSDGSSNDSSDEVSALYEQCGGKGWTGPKKCAAGLTCMNRGEYYSQCLHN